MVTLLYEHCLTWRHVFKLDPNKPISEPDLARICQAESDVIVIGGTDGITYQNTAQLLDRVTRYNQYCVQEVSTLSAVVPGFDGYLIPTVLNTDEPNWFIGNHLAGLKAFGDFVPWEDVLLVAYLICNPAAKVAKLTNAQTKLDIRDMIAYARLADRLYRIPLFYMEYSGTFGDSHKVEAIREELASARLFYGGGLSTRAQVQQMAQFAHTIVVGNLIYDDIDQAVQTVGWVRQVIPEKGRK